MTTIDPTRMQDRFGNHDEEDVNITTFNKTDKN